MVTQGLATFHLWTISLSSDLSCNAHQSATKSARENKILGGVMKKNLAGAVAVAMLALGAVLPALAQESRPIKVTVPFDFAVENNRLHAGDYTIQRAANGALRIQDNDGRTTATVLALPTQGKVTMKETHFIFHRYGNDYFLETIWTPGQNMGWQLLQGKHEIELARSKTSPVETAMVVGH
jgi:hypothetical protein